MRGMIAPRTFGLSLSGQSRCRPAAALRIVACQRTPVAGRFIPGEATAGIRSTPLFCLGMVSWTGMVACEEKACHRGLAPVMTAGRLGRCRHRLQGSGLFPAGDRGSCKRKCPPRLQDTKNGSPPGLGCEEAAPGRQRAASPKSSTKCRSKLCRGRCPSLVQAQRQRLAEQTRFGGRKNSGGRDNTRQGPKQPL
jgi:hypothetical protein